jgi:hypothetical protein
VGLQCNLTRVTTRPLAVHIGDHESRGARSLAAAQRLTPDREEVAKRKRSLHRRLDVNDPVTGVRVQPVKARTRNDKAPLGALLDLPRLADPDAVRYG